MDLGLREAVPSDAEALAGIQAAGFRSAHAGVIDATYLATRVKARSYHTEWAVSFGLKEPAKPSDPAQHRRTVVLTTTPTVPRSSDVAAGAGNGDTRADGAGATSDPAADSASMTSKSTVLGFAAVEPAGRHSLRHAPSHAIQLRKIYLSDACPRRRGCGTALFVAAAQQAVRMHDGDDTATLRPVGLIAWVLEGNVSAIAFYKKMGMYLLTDGHTATFGRKRYGYVAYALDDARAALKTFAAASKAKPA